MVPMYVYQYSSITYAHTYVHIFQGRQKLFITNLTLRAIQLNTWAADNLPMLISFLYQLYYNVISLTGLKITQLLCLLLSFLHNRIPCMHNVWAADNLAPLDMPFLSII